MSRCGWSCSTGKPANRQEYADTHLALVAELAAHLRRDHEAIPDHVAAEAFGFCDGLRLASILVDLVADGEKPDINEAMRRMSAITAGSSRG